MKRNKVVAVALALLLGAPLAAQTAKSVVVQPSLVEKVLKIPNGNIVAVELRNHESYRGRIGAATREGLRMRYASGDSVYEKVIAIEMVKSIRRLESGAESGNAAQTIQERVLAIAAGSEVSVEAGDKTRLEGRMGDASTDGFTLESATGGQGKTLRFSEMQSIKIVARSKHPVLKGVVIGVCVTFVALIALAARAGD